MKKSYGNRPADRPTYWDDPRFNQPSQPVVGVTWFEARAYCLWLEDRWRAAGDAAEPPLAPGQRVALPSEAAWERAARYPRGGRYPWGRRWSPERANTAEGRVLRTTPVGVYPAGATGHGIHDLSGNVWEWTASLYRDYPYRADDGREDPGAEGPRVVRGGSWYSYRRVARCASRSRDHPVNFGSFWGFGWWCPWRILISELLGSDRRVGEPSVARRDGGRHGCAVELPSTRARGAFVVPGSGPYDGRHRPQRWEAMASHARWTPVSADDYLSGEQRAEVRHEFIVEPRGPVLAFGGEARAVRAEGDGLDPSVMRKAGDGAAQHP